jgi:hypothetical protein
MLEQPEVLILTAHKREFPPANPMGRLDSGQIIGIKEVSDNI